MRARFDATRECKDMRKCAAMLQVAEDMLFECQHLYPFKYKFDEGGIMFARVHNFPDYLHDFWHPWEVVSNRFYSLRVLEIIPILWMEGKFHKDFLQMFGVFDHFSKITVQNF